MTVLKNPLIEKIQWAKELEKLKKMFGQTLLRGKDKKTFITAIASALVQYGYVKINEDADLAHLTRDKLKTANC